MPLMTDLSDIELTVLLQEGDQAAFGEIYGRYWQPLLRSAFLVLQDKEAAQDVVQNVFISVWQRRREARIEKLKPYLDSAIRYSVFNAIKGRQHDQAFYARLAQVTAEIIEDNPLLFREQQELLRQLIAALPEDCRETFRLSREENLTYKQIAALLGISEKTVEKRMTKSLKHIRAGLEMGLCLAVIAAFPH